ncbi:MAG: aldo/keto reductase [Phycisphaeraceae bacterium]|nr:aldo/keto reductase [Phycisphaeraceae bacterium]
MLYRRFGRTDLNIPVFSCGGMRYQFKWQDLPLDQVPPDNQANLEATIRRSLELGINHIETARGYGSSERQLGEILPKLPRAKLIVQTKVGPSEDGNRFLQDFDDSLARLKLDHVDLLSVHGVNTRDLMTWTLRPGGCFEAAQKLRRQGKARFVGFSTHAPLDVILDGVNFGSPRTGEGFDYVNLHWYYIFQKNWPAIAAAAARDMGVFIISPSDKGGKLYAPAPKMQELCQPLHPMVFNDLFCLSHPQVHTLSIGAARPSDFDTHLLTLPLLAQAAQTLTPILQRLESAMQQAVGMRADAPFEAGFPDWDKSPGQVNIPVILWLRNLALGWGMTDFGKMRYNLLGNGGHWFPGQRAENVAPLDFSSALSAVLPWARALGYGDATRLQTLLDETHQMLKTEAVKRLSQSD